VHPWKFVATGIGDHYIARVRSLCNAVVVGRDRNLFDLFAPVRGLLTDEEIDTLFARNRSMSRPVDLS
jgi:hypothetical protein